MTVRPNPVIRFNPSLDSQQAFAQGLQSKDIELEQEKLLWADTVILQFPLVVVFDAGDP
jgi:NAD(P)H dehydrogenase (quinone)